MAKFAAGKYAYGISDRSGFRYRLSDMRMEWNGFFVGKDEWESKHPQLEPKRRGTDAEAIRNPRPENNIISATVSFPIFNTQTLTYNPSAKGIGRAGNVVATGGGIVITQTFAVTVSNPGSGNKYFIDSVQQDTVNLTEGNTYRFDQSDSSNSGHPLRFSATSNGTHGGGTQYTTGVTTSGTPGTAGAYTQITVASGAPTLYYYCTNHSGMGGQANTP
tara:strand:- start:916 stop:1569 length:654 start_codon:yes stop_codon:yes gene_type:complete